MNSSPLHVINFRATVQTRCPGLPELYVKDSELINFSERKDGVVILCIVLSH